MTTTKKRSKLKKVKNPLSTSVLARHPDKDEQLKNFSLWMPSNYLILKALLSARLCSAVWGLITDCDETYNYWEPTHFLLYKKGFQTWEYSPEYALRSYTYLLLHAAPSFLYGEIIQPNRMLVFFFIRCLFAGACSASEIYFISGIRKQFGVNVARISLGISVFSAGMFLSSTAFLPSSFAMYMTMISYGAWFHKRLQLAIFTTAISVYLVWPFVAVLGIPIAYDICIRRKKWMMFIKWSALSTVVILVPMIQIDSTYFGRFVMAPLNILTYNIFTSHGPDLYGKEPISFYIFNGILNFNFAFIAALTSILFHFGETKLLNKSRKGGDSLPFCLKLGGMYMWLVIFALQSHKEERFLFPIYPLICVSAAMTIDCAQKMSSHLHNLVKPVKTRYYLPSMNWLALTFLLLTGTIGVSRIVSQYKAYRAPFNVLMELENMYRTNDLIDTKDVNICYGKEWHRFPSSFFVPDLQWNVQFIESEFRGQLPKYYSSSENATSLIPKHMNDLNKEEISRYVDLIQCNFLIDLDKEQETDREPRYSSKSEFEVIYSVPFLDASRSPKLLRAFYVPFLTEKYCFYDDYVLLQRKKRQI